MTQLRLQAKIVSYADDYVICCKGGVKQALAEMRRMMRRLKLTVNEAKTRVCHLPNERFDFLGYGVLQHTRDEEFIMN
jgi:RNA-directed DNA polymerase